MFENPFLKDIKSIYLYSLVWLLITVFYFALTYWGIQVALFTALADSIIFNLILGVLGLGLWYPAKFISYEQGTPVRFIFTHLAGGVIAVALWLYTGYAIVNYLVPFGINYNVFFMSTLVWRILTGLLLYFLIVLFYYLIIYYKEYKDRSVRETELKALITEAELKSLKFQINPHFIFNSLNSISSLTMEDPSKARTMILKLAEFLRYTVHNNTRMLNTLEEELRNVKTYLEIEKIRFEEKFDYIEDVKEGCMKVLVPNMILQPLFENAIKHAVYESLEKIIISVRCSPVKDFLNVEIENTFDKDSIKRGSGVGLKNIKERLSLIYNRNDLFRITSDGNLFKVTLYIPLGTEEQNIT